VTNCDQLFFELVTAATRATSDLQPISDQVTNYIYKIQIEISTIYTWVNAIRYKKLKILGHLVT
jgi:hypothetical protein